MLPLDAGEQSLSVPDPSFGRMQATFNTLAGNPFSSLNELDYNLRDSSNDSDESASEDDNALGKDQWKVNNFTSSSI